jgi:hypothetical protein
MGLVITWTPNHSTVYLTYHPIMWILYPVVNTFLKKERGTASLQMKMNHRRIDDGRVKLKKMSVYLRAHFTNEIRRSIDAVISIYFVKFLD